MCGICGIVSTDANLVTASALEQGAAVLRHRGPDDAGRWLWRDDHASVGLAHLRLSIIDLSVAGHQPMTNETGSAWLTYNGEIYNHAALRQELQQAGHSYRSHTDSETILHAFEQWGDRCVERFRGMFAFAIWDGERRRLLLARDRLGIKPLYYTVSGGTLMFASEIKSLLAMGLRPRVGAGALSEYLAYGYRAGSETMFEGVHQVPPGHVLSWSDGKIEIQPYWRLEFSHPDDVPEQELATEFRRLFEESVQLRLMSDVPLGVFLSGGLDSSAIAAAMSRMVTTRIKTFSVGYESQYFSELSFARQVAEHIGADHHEVVLTADAFFEAIPRLVWHEDEPLWGMASVALFAVSELASKHVKVVLTGEGSDELFAGYDRYWMTAVNAKALPAYRMLPASVRGALRRLLLDGPLPERARRALGHTVVKYDRMPDGLYLENWLGVFPPDWQRQIAAPGLLKDLGATDVHAAHRRLYESSGSDELVDRLLYTDIKSNLVELLMKQDQMSMATSIESRVPFLDHHLVEFAARVPARYKIKGTSGKHLVKQALADYLPAEIVHRRKMGFPVPYEQWLQTRFMPHIEQLLLSEQALDRGWFRADAVRGLLATHRGGSVNLSRQIWNLWMLEAWARIFLDGERPATTAPTAAARTLEASALAGR